MVVNQCESDARCGGQENTNEHTCVRHWPCTSPVQNVVPGGERLFSSGLCRPEHRPGAPACFPTRLTASSGCAPPSWRERGRKHSLTTVSVSTSHVMEKTPKRRRGREQTKVGGQRGRPGALRPALHRGTSCICETDEPVSSASVSAVSPVVGIQSDPQTNRGGNPGTQGEFCTMGQRWAQHSQRLSWQWEGMEAACSAGRRHQGLSPLGPRGTQRRAHQLQLKPWELTQRVGRAPQRYLATHVTTLTYIYREGDINTRGLHIYSVALLSDLWKLTGTPHTWELGGYVSRNDD